MSLPGMPDTTRRVHAVALENGWGAKVDENGAPLARRRAARGGGTEYHASLLPPAAQLALRSRQEPADAPAQAPGGVPDVAERWAWFDCRSSKVKAEANRRLSILREVDERVAVGIGKGAAATTIAAAHGTSRSVIFDWFKMVADVPAADRLPFLAPQHKGGQARVEIDAVAWQIIKTDYLRPEKPAFAACYRRLRDDYAKPRGIVLPAEKTLQRRMEAEITASLKKAKREGREASRRSVPPLRRSVLDLHAMEAVNVDGHTFDVFVEWEDGSISRPVLVGTQDVFSRKLLTHRIGKTESAILTRLAFADLFRDYGIPSKASMDNGRAFASKAITGGARTRFRFKIKDDDALGILPALGVDPKWTLPYRGSSKPIERAWRDLCEDASKHPFCSGAYTGNKPDAKPENYRSRAIPIAEFRPFVIRQIAAHNAREGRRTETTKGGSFDATFAASYAVSPIGKATDAQLRMALLEAQDRRCNRENGTVTLAGNVYWSPAMVNLAGKMVTVRFDPDNYHQDVHIYLRNGEYFGAAQVISAIGFYDKSGAEARGKLEKNLSRAIRDAEKAAELLHIDELKALLSGDPTPAPLPDAGVVRPVRHRGNTAAALKPIQQVEATPDPAIPSFTDNVIAGFAKSRLRSVE